MRQQKKTLIMLTLSGGDDGRRVMTKMLVMVFEQLSKALSGLDFVWRGVQFKLRDNFVTN